MANHATMVSKAEIRSFEDPVIIVLKDFVNNPIFPLQ